LRIFRVKNHDFTAKNHIFSNFRGGARNFWGISCEKSRFYAKKIIFFPILGGARAGCAPPPGSAPDANHLFANRERALSNLTEKMFVLTFRMSDLLL
jgi:hypothetical protein